MAARQRLFRVQNLQDSKAMAERQRLFRVQNLEGFKGGGKKIRGD
jgi:hypothetical protein